MGGLNHWFFLPFALTCFSVVGVTLAAVVGGFFAAPFGFYYFPLVCWSLAGFCAYWLEFLRVRLIQVLYDPLLWDDMNLALMTVNAVTSFIVSFVVFAITSKFS